MDASEPSEELYALARRNWLYNDARDSSVDPDARERALRNADLEDVYDLAFEVIDDPSQRQDYLIAMIDTRRNDDVDLNLLGAGWLEDVWHDGDREILDKLRHRGVPAAIIAILGASLQR